MPLYHARIFIPQTVKIPRGKFAMEYTGHAIDQFHDRRVRQLPESVDMSKCRVVEVETNETGEITKMLIRSSHNERCDLVAAVIPVDGKFLVKTVWVNDKRDNHKTLDITRYSRK